MEREGSLNRHLSPEVTQPENRYLELDYPKQLDDQEQASQSQDITKMSLRDILEFYL